MAHTELTPGPIGVFDSGYGGLTILREICRRLPEYQYIYLGDNARAPYGSRSFDVIYDFTLQAVEFLFHRGCNLIILACNTASAKALRSIQQNVLPHRWPGRRVLGVIRPTVEAVGDITASRHVALLATPGTVRSHSYRMEIAKIHPDITITEQECPMWVPLVETGEATGPGADYFVRKYIEEVMQRDPQIDTILLGCTHYPLLLPKIEKYAPAGTRIVTQGEIVAESLADYLRRHPEMAAICSLSTPYTEHTAPGTECPPSSAEARINGPHPHIDFLTTESTESFDRLASLFVGLPVNSSRVKI